MTGARRGLRAKPGIFIFCSASYPAPLCIFLPRLVASEAGTPQRNRAERGTAERCPLPIQPSAPTEDGRGRERGRGARAPDSPPPPRRRCGAGRGARPRGAAPPPRPAEEAPAARHSPGFPVRSGEVRARAALAAGGRAGCRSAAAPPPSLPPFGSPVTMDIRRVSPPLPPAHWEGSGCRAARRAPTCRPPPRVTLPPHEPLLRAPSRRHRTLAAPSAEAGDTPPHVTQPPPRTPRGRTRRTVGCVLARPLPVSAVGAPPPRGRRDSACTGSEGAPHGSPGVSSKPPLADQCSVCNAAGRPPCRERPGGQQGRD